MTAIPLLYPPIDATPPVTATERMRKLTGGSRSRAGMWYEISGEPKENNSESGETGG